MKTRFWTLLALVLFGSATPAQTVDSPVYSADFQWQAIIACVQTEHPDSLASAIVIGYDPDRHVAYILGSAHATPPEGGNLSVCFFRREIYPLTGVMSEEAQVVAHDRSDDLALLKVRLGRPPAAILPVASCIPELNQPVLLVGCGGGQPPYCRAGTLKTTTWGSDYLSELATVPGDSGGAVILGGKLIGVHVRHGGNGAEAVHLRKIWRFLDQHGYGFLYRNSPAAQASFHVVPPDKEHVLVIVWLVLEVILVFWRHA